MNAQDKTPIHETMEKQSIVGNITSLQERISIIAAVNPIKWRYESRLSFYDNV